MTDERTLIAEETLLAERALTAEGTLIAGPPRPVRRPAVDADAGARELISAMLVDRWGRTSPSIYETARLVGLAPWLPGHRRRIDYLLDRQRPDGGWGPPEGYALIPTLSATEALLRTYRFGDAPLGGAGRLRLAGALGRALRALDRWLRPGRGLTIADTPAADLIVPALVIGINEHLDGLRAAPVDPLGRWPENWPTLVALPLPAGITPARLTATRRAIATGAGVPEKLLHALEVVGDLARRAPGVRPAPPGLVGASPAATAAWLGQPGSGSHSGPGPGSGSGGVMSDGAERAAARRFLAEVIRPGSGAVPCATPITVFERSWVLSGLTRVGMAPVVPAELVRGLTAAIGPTGAAAGPGLPADADTTSVVLYALARLGEPAPLASLWRYDTGGHFCTWLGEDGSSITTNAHVLEALGHAIPVGTAAGAHRLSVARRLAEWLCERQQPGGEWVDRWHASPYYATACAALALDRYGPGARATGTAATAATAGTTAAAAAGRAVSRAVSRAVDWVLGTQRANGSWGRWAGTVEETAYAMQVLLATGQPDRDRIGPAAARGHAYLLAAAGQEEDPPLWHDKDLYAPYSIVRSATLAALKLAESRPDLMTSANLSMR